MMAGPHLSSRVGCPVQIHPWQQTWPGYALYKRMSRPKSMQIHIPGW